MDNKVAVVPDYIAEWIEYCKRNSFTLFGCFDPVDMFESLVDDRVYWSYHCRYSK